MVKLLNFLLFILPQKGYHLRIQDNLKKATGITTTLEIIIQKLVWNKDQRKNLLLTIFGCYLRSEKKKTRTFLLLLPPHMSSAHWLVNVHHMCLCLLSSPSLMWPNRTTCVSIVHAYIVFWALRKWEDASFVMARLIYWLTQLLLHNKCDDVYSYAYTLYKNID